MKFKELLDELDETIQWAMIVKKTLEGPDFKFTKRGGNGIVKRKGKNLLIFKSFHFGEDDAINALVKDWSAGGTYNQYFADEHDLEIMVKQSGSDIKSDLFGPDGGAVWVEIKVRT